MKRNVNSFLRKSSKSSVWALAWKKKPRVTKMDTKIVVRARCFILFCYLFAISRWSLFEHCYSLAATLCLFSKLSPLAIQSGQAMPPHAHDDVVKSKTWPAFADSLCLHLHPLLLIFQPISDNRKKISRWLRRLQSWIAAHNVHLIKVNIYQQGRRWPLSLSWSFQNKFICPLVSLVPTQGEQ